MTSLSENWRKAKLGDVAKNLDSKRVPLSSMQRSKMKGEFPYYGAAEIVDHINDYKYEGLHLLVAEDGTVETDSGHLVIQLAIGRFWVNNHAHVLRGEDEEDTKYLFYALSRINATPYITGAVQLKLTQQNLNRIEIPFPDKPKRKQIVQTISVFDSKIENNNRIIKILEEMAQAIFKEWFVKFRFPRHEKAEFVESELGKIPAGWEVNPFGVVAEFDKGLSYKGAGLNHDGKPMINLGCFLRGGKFTYENLKYYSGEFRPRHIVHHGDLLISNTDITQEREIMGNPVIVGEWDGNQEYLFTHHIYVVRPKQKIDNTFLYYLLRQPAFRGRVVGAASGTNILGLSKEAISSFQLVVPDEKLISKFVKVAKPILDKISVTKKENAILSKTRDLLLPKLMSGKVRV